SQQRSLVLSAHVANILGHGWIVLFLTSLLPAQFQVVIDSCVSGVLCCRPQEMRPVEESKQLRERRARAIALLSDGLTQAQVADRLRVHPRSVRRWNAAYHLAGAAGLAARPVPGRPSKLTARQREQLARLLKRGARAAGFETDQWTCPRVARLIDRRFGIR